MDSKEIKKQAEETQKVGDAQRENLFITRDINNEIREGLKLISQEKDLKNAVRKSLTALNKQAEFQVDIAKTTNKALTDTNGILKKQEDYSKGLNNLRRENQQLGKAIKTQENDLAATKKNLTDDQIKAQQKEIDNSKSLQKGIANQIINQKEGVKILDSQVAASKQLAGLGSVKLFSSLSAVAKAIPGVGQLTSGFEEAAKASAEAAASMVKIGKDGTASALSGIDKVKAGFKGLSAGVGKLMDSFGPLAILTKVFSGMMKADESAGKIAKGLNISTKEAGKLSSEMLKTSLSSKELGVTYEGQKHALMSINAEMGTSTAISAKTLATFSQLEKVAGMTQEEMMGIGKLSFATGKDMKQMTGEFLAQAKSASLKHGVLLNEKKLMASISKVSAATTLSLGKNPKAIAKAVATAKALGMEMGQVENIANSLLDFESSIEKEMEAELMLGKNLNLEKARTAALNNDMATVAEEIAKQAGSAAEFGEMNRLQQEALAAAVGMGREELAQSLYTQEQLQGLTGEAAAAEQEKLDHAIEKFGLEKAMKMESEGQLDNLLAQASLQEEAALAAEKTNEMFMAAGKNLLPIVEQMTKLATFASQNLEYMIAAVAIYKTYQAYQKISNVLEKKNIVLKGLGIGKMIATLAIQAAKSVATIPVVGAVLAVAAGIGAFALGKSLMGKGDAIGDLDSPSGGMTQVSTKEGGLFNLSPNDDLVAAPGASKALANAQSGGGNTMAMKRLEELQAQTNSLLSRIASTQGTVTMDAEKMGTAVSMNTYEISP